MAAIIMIIALGAIWLIVVPILGWIGFNRASTALKDIDGLRRALDRHGRDIAPPLVEREIVPPSVDEPELPLFAPDIGVSPSRHAAAPRTTTRDQPDLESELTMRWGVWLGAIALLLAGVFMLRYASDQGLFGPAVRCATVALLGVLLLAGAEWLQRAPVPAIEGPFQADMAPSALAAGGVSALFAAAYGSGPFYHLLPPVVVLALMAAASILGLAAALRFGPLTAAVGIVGAFAAPALLETASPSLAGLFAYLALATVAAYEIVWRTAWAWLGWAIAAAAAFWLAAVGLMPPPGHDLWPAAAYLLLAAFFGLLLPDDALDDPRGRLLAFGQMAIVAAGGLVLEACAPGIDIRWALLLLAPIALWKGADAPFLDRLPWLSAAIGLGAFFLWDGASTAELVAPPNDVPPFIFAAFLFALFHLGAGLALEGRAARPGNWSSLVATVPLAVLTLAYAKVGRFEPDLRWGVTGLVLVIALGAASFRALRTVSRDCGGLHAAGAVAALALSLAMVLREQALLIAFAMMLPALGWIEAKVRSREIRFAALILAMLTLGLAARGFLIEVFAPIDAWAKTEAYALPAVAFFLAVRMFRQERDDLLVATLRSGAIGLASIFTLFLVRLAFGQPTLDAVYSLEELAALLLVSATQALAYAHAARSSGCHVFAVAAVLLGMVASLLAAGLLVFNPLLVRHGPITGFTLILAYLVPAVIAGLAARRAALPAKIAGALGGYAFVGGLAFVTLFVRHFFHPGRMTIRDAPIEEAEAWVWSVTWLVFALLVMLVGIGIRVRRLRLAAMALVALVCCKTFLWDMADLTGLWRVASFLGLGLSLIGLSALHRRYVLPTQTTS